MTRIDRLTGSDSDSASSTNSATAMASKMAHVDHSKFKPRPKSKILFYTPPNAPPDVLEKLKVEVEMVVVQPGDYETSKKRIKETVDRHGIFEAFVVSFIEPAYPGDEYGGWRMEDGQ